MNPSDPNLNPKDLLELAKEYPKEVLNNFSLELIPLEDPVIHEEVIDLCCRVIANKSAGMFELSFKSYDFNNGDGYSGNFYGGGYGDGFRYGSRSNGNGIGYGYGDGNGNGGNGGNGHGDGACSSSDSIRNLKGGNRKGGQGSKIWYGITTEDFRERNGEDSGTDCARRRATSLRNKGPSPLTLATKDLPYYYERTGG